MKNDDFEIPDYEELDNNKNINMNNSYRLPKRKAKTVKQRYEEHVQAALDYRADVAESNQEVSQENKQQQQQVAPWGLYRKNAWFGGLSLSWGVMPLGLATTS